MMQGDLMNSEESSRKLGEFWSQSFFLINIIIIINNKDILGENLVIVFDGDGGNMKGLGLTRIDIYFILLIMPGKKRLTH